MLECIELARRLGRRVGEELSIPVYLYEEAATQPDRHNLENIRRGEYENLKVEIGKDPDRTPDYGPAVLGPAGATVIGARQPLIAYNVYLTTDDVSIAQNIARVIRHSSGGLRYVKSLGLLVHGRAQVSMNLTNYRQTSVARVVEMIRREAARYGVSIHHSELVGLIPQEALVDAALWHLQLDSFNPDQILEQRLFGVVSRRAVPEDGAAAPGLLDQLASASPTPGGGSASAHSGAVAAALVAMVGRLTVGKKKYAGVEGRMWEIIERADLIREELNRAVHEDAASYEAVMAARRLPKDTPEQEEARSRAIDQSMLGAAEVPLQVALRAVEVMELAVEVAETGNTNAIADAASGAAMARAALRGAALNVQVNVQGVKHLRGAGEPAMAEVRRLEGQADTLEERLQKILAERGGFDLS
jgi:glutamate formiminotransferase/formiminotetrahydrofolate cyclodeaminase